MRRQHHGAQSGTATRRVEGAPVGGGRATTARAWARSAQPQRVGGGQPLKTARSA